MWILLTLSSLNCNKRCGNSFSKYQRFVVFNVYKLFFNQHASINKTIYEQIIIFLVKNDQAWKSPICLFSLDLLSKGKTNRMRFK